MMEIIEYPALKTASVKKQYEKVIAMIRKGDLYSAEVKKLSPTGYYRAKLDHTNRLLLKFVTYQQQSYALILEVILHHAYDRSKFLNGTPVQKSVSLKVDETIDSEPIRYLNTQNPNIHRLDKLISWDDDQYAAFELSPPAIIIGPAGSGKTALTLEKLKGCSGCILYVTHSLYLVHHARELYEANTCDDLDESQSIDFLSYQEFIETIQIPKGTELSFNAFRQWLRRYHKTYDPHTLYEEFKGVISGNQMDSAYLSKEDYLNLGVKQSIYARDDRQAVYALYEKYLQFLGSSTHYDMNLMSHDYLDRVAPYYDFIVMDEIQDFTMVQLCLLLKSLKTAGQFLLCGDSNQIVHPNFFSWAQVKTLFYEGTVSVNQPVTCILHTNYRSSDQVTHLANRVLTLKNARFGSVDRESNYLMKSQGFDTGALHLLDPSANERLNKQTKKSTHYAVIVLRDELKAHAKQHFDTPLIFSIHEAKGLEYENIILYDLIGSERRAFADIARGISLDDLTQGLTYARAKNKSDRSLEVYKFYINALYVAITRAVKTIYWIESDLKHPLLTLLQLQVSQTTITLNDKESSQEAWQQEARKLRLQGKQDQADAIYDQFVKEESVPWEVLTLEQVDRLKATVLNNPQASKQAKIMLLEYALIHDETLIIQALVELGVQAAKKPDKAEAIIASKYYDPYKSKNSNLAMKQIEKYGVNFRNCFNQTILMVVAYVGNEHLASALLNAGADPNLLNNDQKTAFHVGFQRALSDPTYANKKFSGIYRLLAPDSLSLKLDDRLIKLDRRRMEYLLIHVFLDVISFSKKTRCLFVLTAADIRQLIVVFPDHLVPAFRKKQSYISSYLSKNELNRKGSYNYGLFQRIQRGKYIINPALMIKVSDNWQPFEVRD